MAEASSDTAVAKRITRTVRCFNASGRLQRWPSRRADQELVLWIVWSQMPDNGQMSELDVNAMLRGWHDIEDYVLLRRELCDMGLLRRTPDGKIYRKINHPIPDDAAAAIERVENPD